MVDALAAEPEQVDKSVYAYAWNNPTNLTDPDGNCPMCVGALVGALTDVAIQTAEIMMDDSKSFSKDFKPESVVVSAIAGATGVGLASKLGKLGTVAKIGVELAHDATANVAGQVAKGENVDLTKAGVGAMTGKVVGDGAQKLTASRVTQSAPAKLLQNEANRASRITAQNPRPSRIEASKTPVKRLQIMYKIGQLLVA